MSGGNLTSDQSSATVSDMAPSSLRAMIEAERKLEKERESHLESLRSIVESKRKLKKIEILSDSVGCPIMRLHTVGTGVTVCPVNPQDIEVISNALLSFVATGGEDIDWDLN